MNQQRLRDILNGLSIANQTVSNHAVNINCPYCIGRRSGREDTKYRCGIFLSSLRYHCFRCKRTGSLYKLLDTLVKTTSEQYESLIGKEVLPEDETLSDHVRNRIQGTSAREQVIIKPPQDPRGSSLTYDLVDQYPLLRSWLKARQIEAQTLIDYGVRYGGNVGPNAHRLILPVYDEAGKMVAWQGRDISGRRRMKYFTQGNVTDYLFWTEYIKTPYVIYLVEGIFDCLRMEYNAVASFSHSLSRRQRTLLFDNQNLIDKLIVCWDADSYGKAIGCAQNLAPILRKVGVVRLPEGQDPDSLGGDEIRKLKVRWV